MTAERTLVKGSEKLSGIKHFFQGSLKSVATFVFLHIFNSFDSIKRAAAMI